MLIWLSIGTLKMELFQLALFLLITLCSKVKSDDVSPNPKYLYDIPVSENPAFCSLLEDTDAQSAGKYDLAFSAFTGDISVKDTVTKLNGINEFQLQSSFDSDMLTDVLVWPNEVSQVPEAVFTSRVWAVASGFFLPGKDNGSIALLDITNSFGPVIISSSDEKLWFYHRVLWEDMNNDGHLDAVTARAYGTGASATEAQLVWFENPGIKQPTSGWKVHILHEGTEDISFRIHYMKLQDGSYTPVIISAGFWSFELGLTWSSTNDWQDASSIQHMAVDNYGWYFDLQIVDVNMDGVLDILCTTWSQLGSPGALLAYEIPDDWQNQAWTRHVLQDGYKSFRLPGSGSPGTATAFWPIMDMKLAGLKPYIMVSGDDDGKVFVVTADTQDSNDWSYTSTTIYEQEKGTVGAIAVGDADGDGISDVFLPSYEKKFIRVMTYEQ